MQKKSLVQTIRAGFFVFLAGVSILVRGEIKSNYLFEEIAKTEKALYIWQLGGVKMDKGRWTIDDSLKGEAAVKARRPASRQACKPTSRQARKPVCEG